MKGLSSHWRKEAIRHSLWVKDDKEGLGVKRKCLWPLTFTLLAVAAQYTLPGNTTNTQYTIKPPLENTWNFKWDIHAGVGVSASATRSVNYTLLIVLKLHYPPKNVFITVPHNPYTPQQYHSNLICFYLIKQTKKSHYIHLGALSGIGHGGPFSPWSYRKSGALHQFNSCSLI